MAGVSQGACAETNLLQLVIRFKPGGAGGRTPLSLTVCLWVLSNVLALPCCAGGDAVAATRGAGGGGKGLTGTPSQVYIVGWPGGGGGGVPPSLTVCF